MSMISKQIDDLRAYAKDRKGELAKLVSDAADTIEMLSAQPDIILCPNCRYNDGTAYCELHYRDVKAKDFCSWAERRE